MANVSTSNTNHYGSTTNINTATSGALIPLDYQGRKLSDLYVISILNSGNGIFRAQVDNKNWTTFFKLNNNNAFSFNAKGGSSAPYRIWVSHSYNNGIYNWEADNIQSGYLFGGAASYFVFDNHNADASWRSSEYSGHRVLWGYSGYSGIYGNGNNGTLYNGLLWVK